MRVLAAMATVAFLLSPTIALHAEEAAPIVAARPHAAELDALFQSLKATSDQDEADRIEAQIWALWLDSGDTKINALMAQTLLAMNVHAYGAALTNLDEIVTLKPDYAEGWNKRATLYWMLGQYRESLADIDKTLALEPRHFGALSGRGMIMREMGDLAQAMQAFRQALDADPNLADVRAALKALEAAGGKDI
jgi:tetratricopeptide (TPR) repeat protein